MPPAAPPAPVDLAHERAELVRAREAVEHKLAKLAGLSELGSTGADALADEYIGAVVAGAVEKLQHELVVFGRIDDEHAWRVGLYGIDSAGEQLVVDWRAPFAGAFYQAHGGDPMGLARRVSYVGCIEDLFVEDFDSGEVSGSSPLLAELSRSRGTEMRTAVATLQAEQDALVRLDPAARLVLRGGPGTGKTVVGLHRAAWLVYNDTRVTADRILVLGPSDRFLRFVAAVLPTLGEARINQTTFERLLGAASPSATDPSWDEAWLAALDRLDAGLVHPAELRLGGRIIPADTVAELAGRLLEGSLPWRDRRKVFVGRLAAQYELKHGDVSRAAAEIWPTVTTTQVLRRLRNRATLAELGLDRAHVDAWLKAPHDGGLTDEVRARVEGVPARYAHVIVDEAQDLSLLRLRAVMRRADGVTLVGDDAQRSDPAGIGLRRAAALLDTELASMATAYRMSAEIAEWLNAHAVAEGIDAVALLGIRPTGRPVRTAADAAAALAELADRWDNVALITADEVWVHKGIEYDGVVVDTAGMTGHEVYLAASRAAHELVVV
jgi:hypothetical protein